MGSLSLLQGIFPIQGSNPDLPHCRWILYQLSHQGGPRILAWVAYPFCRGLPDPGIELGSPALQVNSLPAKLPGKPADLHMYMRLHGSTHVRVGMYKHMYVAHVHIHTHVSLNLLCDPRWQACVCVHVALTLACECHCVLCWLLSMEIRTGTGQGAGGWGAGCQPSAEAVPLRT